MAALEAGYLENDGTFLSLTSNEDAAAFQKLHIVSAVSSDQLCHLTQFVIVVAHVGRSAASPLEKGWAFKKTADGEDAWKPRGSNTDGGSYELDG